MLQADSMDLVKSNSEEQNQSGALGNERSRCRNTIVKVNADVRSFLRSFQTFLSFLWLTLGSCSQPAVRLKYQYLIF